MTQIFSRSTNQKASSSMSSPFQARKNDEKKQKDAAWRPKLADDLRALKTINVAISKQRKTSLNARFPGVTALPTIAEPKGGYLRQWSPVINSAAILPVCMSLIQWGTRVAMEEAIALMVGKTTAEALANQVMQFSAASWAAETFRIVNGPLVDNWKNVSVQKFYDKVIKITIRDERIWAIQEDRRARHADLSYGANQTVGTSVEYVQHIVDNNVAVLALLLSTTVGVASIGSIGFAAPILGVSVLMLSQKFVQASLHQREMDTEVALNMVDNSMNDHLQINNT